MFDLIEEVLTAKAAEPPPIAPPKKPLLSSDPLVISMPERFRVLPKKHSSMVLISLIGGASVLVMVAVLGVVLVANQSKKQPALVQQPEPAVAAAPVVQTPSSTQSVLATSTESTLDASSTAAASSEATTTELALPPLSPSPERAESPSPAVIATVAGVDSDSDNLTDFEEELFGTNQNKPDSNENSYLDGNEIVAGYDPISMPGGGHLGNAQNISLFKNLELGYTALHPRLWIAKEVNALQREVLISAATGEFVSVKGEDNPKKLTPREWAANYAQIPATQLMENRKNTVWPDRPNVLISETLDGLGAFVAPIDATGVVSSSRIIRLTYNLNTKQELNFATVFKMIVNSIRFISASSPEMVAQQPVSSSPSSTQTQPAP